MKLLLASLVLVCAAQFAQAQPVREREFEPVNRSWQTPFKLPEYILRVGVYPLQKLLEWEEEFFVSERVLDLISNEDRTVFLYPLFFYSTSDGLWFGIEYSHENFVFDDDQFALGGQIRANGDYVIESNYELDADYHFFGAAEFLALYRKDSNNEYFGRGPNSSRLNESIYELNEVILHSEGYFDLNPTSTLRLGLSLTFEHLTSETGNDDDDLSSVETVFSANELIGFEKDLTYLNPGLSLAYDTRPEKPHPTNGSLVKLAYKRGYTTSGNSEFDYDQYNIQLVHLIQVEVTRRALAIGLNYQQVSDSTPFFRQSELGDDGPLRGYDDNRFVDSRYIVGNLEYRYKIWESLVPETAYALGTLFVDAGQVFEDFAEVKGENIQYSGGMGISIGVSDHTLYRVQLALGGEGLSFIFAANQAF